jgi:hypothetical protein
VQQETTSGYSWSIKELIPFLIALSTALGGLVGIYATMSSRVSMLEVELNSLKKEQSNTASKLESIVQSNIDLTIYVRSLISGLDTLPSKRK